MELFNAVSATYPRAVSSATEGSWRGQEKQPVEQVQHKQQPQAQEERNSKVERQNQHQEQQINDVINRSRNEQKADAAAELIREQQSSMVYNRGTQSQTQQTNQEPRRRESASRREPYSLASYTGQQANQRYLELTNLQHGKVIDEIV